MGWRVGTPKSERIVIRKGTPHYETKDRRGVPIAADRCDKYERGQRCIRARGHGGRHVTSASFRR